MTDTFQPVLQFDAASRAAEDGEALIVDLEGYEGPLHALLALARSQKVDLMKLSISKLADQYLAFVKRASRLQFSLAADYLVMASWLAYLKSRLLLPKSQRPAAEEPPPEQIAAQLAWRLAKLDAMRRAGDNLAALPRLKRDVFTRGDPQAITIIPSQKLEGDLYGLMTAYVSFRRREIDRTYAPTAPTAYPLEAARDRLRHLLPEMASWTPLAGVAPEGSEADDAGPSRASCVASTLAASLELVKEGALEARQTQAFADLYLRKRSGARAA
jgi:segregation and condensation protein A